MFISQQVRAPTGRYTVVAASPLDAVRRSVDALSRSLWVAVPCLVLLVGVVAWYVTGRALRPVEAIRAEVESITATSLDRRVPEPQTHDEVRQWTHAVAYRGGWSDRAELSLGLQKTSYEKQVTEPEATPQLGKDDPWLYNIGVALYSSERAPARMPAGASGTIICTSDGSGIVDST